MVLLSQEGTRMGNCECRFVTTLPFFFSLVHLPSSDPDLELQLVAFIDPLSPTAQRIAPLIQTLHTATSMDVKLYLNPISKLSEVPIKSFYRYVLEAELSFEEDGR